MVSATPLDADNKAAPSTSIRGSIAMKMGMTHFIALTNVRLRFAAYLHICRNDSREKITFSLPKPSTFPFYEHYGLLRPTVVSIELELTRKRLTECDASNLVPPGTATSRRVISIAPDKLPEFAPEPPIPCTTCFAKNPILSSTKP